MQYISDHLREYESAARDIPGGLHEVHRLLGGKWKLALFSDTALTATGLRGWSLTIDIFV